MASTKKIYIDIQSLLEIRQSTLTHLLGADKALDLVHNKSYYLRDVEVFEGVDMAAYSEASKDPAIALKYATVTYMISVLMNRLSQMEKLNSFQNEEATTELVLNIYPYRLPKEAVEVIRDAVFVKLRVPVMITIVNDDPSVWSPMYIKNSGVVHFYCYDCTTWMDRFGEEISGGMLRDVRMFFPSLGKEQLDKAQLKEVQKAGFRDIFAYTEFLLSPYMRVQFLPSVFYSNIFVSTKILEDFDEELVRKPLTPEEKQEDSQAQSASSEQTKE